MGEVGGDTLVGIVGSYFRSRLKCISSQSTIHTQMTRAGLLLPSPPLFDASPRWSVDREHCPLVMASPQIPGFPIAEVVVALLIS